MPSVYAIANIGAALRLNARRRAAKQGGAAIRRGADVTLEDFRRLNRLGNISQRLRGRMPVIWDPLGPRVVRRTLTGSGIVRAQRRTLGLL